MPLDEPTTYLDRAHRIDVPDLVRRLHRESGRTVVVPHALNPAARYADRLVAVKDGRIVVADPPAEVLTESTLLDVSGLDAKVVPDPVAGTPSCPSATTADAGGPGTRPHGIRCWGRAL